MFSKKNKLKLTDFECNLLWGRMNESVIMERISLFFLRQYPGEGLFGKRFIP